MSGMGGMSGMSGPGRAGSSGMALPPGWVAPHANRVPGFPQDAYMENPNMAMDRAVAKPETWGMPPDWTEAIQGMMTVVRVVPPAMYDKIQQLRAQAGETS